MKNIKGVSLNSVAATMLIIFQASFLNSAQAGTFTSLKEALSPGLRMITSRATRANCGSPQSIVESQEQVPPPQLSQLENFNVAAWSRADFSETTAWSVDLNNLFQNLEQSRFSHILKISLVTLSGTDWSRDEVAKEAQTLATLYAQCGIKLEAEIIQTRNNLGNAIVEDAKDRGPLSRHQFGLRTPIRNRAVVYLFDGFEGHRGSNSISTPLWHHGADCSHLDYSWISSDAKRKPYSVVAHELTHNLANVGHSPGLNRLKAGEPGWETNCDRNHYLCNPGEEESTERSIMHGNSAYRPNRMTPLLCNRIKSHPLLQAL